MSLGIPAYGCSHKLGALLTMRALLTLFGVYLSFLLICGSSQAAMSNQSHFVSPHGIEECDGTRPGISYRQGSYQPGPYRRREGGLPNLCKPPSEDVASRSFRWRGSYKGPIARNRAAWTASPAMNTGIHQKLELSARRLHTCSKPSLPRLQSGQGLHGDFSGIQSLQEPMLLFCV